MGIYQKETYDSFKVIKFVTNKNLEISKEHEHENRAYFLLLTRNVIRKKYSVTLSLGIDIKSKNAELRNKGSWKISKNLMYMKLLVNLKARNGF